MSTSVTAVELLGKVRDELAFTALGWKVFETTFTRDNLDLMTRSAGDFFQVVSFALQRDILLALARLTDPPQMGPHANISLQALIDAVPADAPARQRAERSPTLATLVKLAKALDVEVVDFFKSERTAKN